MIKQDNHPRTIPVLCCMTHTHSFTLLWFFVFLLISILSGNQVGNSQPSDYAEIHSDSTAVQEGITAYRQNRFQDAVDLLSSSPTPMARLFLAKSYYALGLYEIAIETASVLSTNPPIAIANEAQFVRALSHYQLKQFGHALELLYMLQSLAIDPLLREQAETMYAQLIRYLSVSQRIQLLGNVRNNAILLDIASPEVVFIGNDSDRDRLQHAIRRLNGAENFTYSLSQNPLSSVPSGTIYRIGVLLPGFEDNEADRAVSRGLFNGILLAADAFNRAHDDRKIKVIFSDIDTFGSNPGSGLTQMIDNHHIDFIIGPLFSEQVSQLSSIVNRRQTPLFAPLANSLDLARNNQYVFQMNPSFQARGEQYAQFLVQSLQKRRIGVITEQGSFGEIEANAFRTEAERLGAEVPLFFSEDFSRTGFSVSHILPWFANDIVHIQDTISYRADSLDAVFLSFTSDVAETLLDNTLTGIEAFLPDYTILSNETLSYLDHSIQRIRRLRLIYADTYYLSEQREDVINFRYDYRNRTGFEPSMFSYLGYDLGSYIAAFLKWNPNPDNFISTVNSLPEFDGLATRIFFGEGRMNESLQFFRLTTQGIERVVSIMQEDDAPEAEQEDFQEP